VRIYSKWGRISFYKYKEIRVNTVSLTAPAEREKDTDRIKRKTKGEEKVLNLWGQIESVTKELFYA
jgi:hypothetical protein